MLELIITAVVLTVLGLSLGRTAWLRTAREPSMNLFLTGELLAVTHDRTARSLGGRSVGPSRVSIKLEAGGTRDDTAPAASDGCASSSPGSTVHGQRVDSQRMRPARSWRSRAQSSAGVSSAPPKRRSRRWYSATHSRSVWRSKSGHSTSVNTSSA
jgi:hypothetical protein